jgi:hypothetical protein
MGSRPEYLCIAVLKGGRPLLPRVVRGLGFPWQCHGSELRGAAHGGREPLGEPEVQPFPDLLRRVGAPAYAVP